MKQMCNMLFLDARKYSREQARNMWSNNTSFPGIGTNEVVTKKTVLHFQALYSRIYIQYKSGVIEV